MTEQIAASGHSTHARPDWDAQVAAQGRIELAEGIWLVPHTPLIGASVLGLDLAAGIGAMELNALTDAFLRYKVLMIRSGGTWQMDVDQHTRFCQQLSEHWNLGADTDQKRMNQSSGLTVHPFLPWRRGYPHIWPTNSLAGGGQQYLLKGAEEIDNFEPFAAQKRARSAAANKPARTAPKPLRAGSFGATAVAQDSVDNGANGFHFDDGFFHQPPSAVVLNARVLPKVGGDTIFADMGAAYRGLPTQLQERAKRLTQTMDWRHTFPVWEKEADRRTQAEGDNEFARHVEQLKRSYPPSRQPLIRKHPVTGELSIYANLGFTRWVDDVSAEDSRELIARLCRMAERPEYQVRMRWENAGDVCVYDNRITNHYAVADYGNVGPRALHHIALLGEPTSNAFDEVIG